MGSVLGLYSALVEIRNREGALLRQFATKRLTQKRTPLPQTKGNTPTDKSPGADREAPAAALPQGLQDLVELTLVIAVWGFVSDCAFRAALAEAPPDPGYASCRRLEGLSNVLLRPYGALRPFVGLEQDAGAVLLARGAFAPANPFQKTAPLLDRKFNTVPFSCHETDVVVRRSTREHGQYGNRA